LRQENIQKVILDIILNQMQFKMLN